jgi:hypothetical protein
LYLLQREVYQTLHPRPSTFTTYKPFLPLDLFPPSHSTFPQI